MSSAECLGRPAAAQWSGLASPIQLCQQEHWRRRCGDRPFVMAGNAAKVKGEYRRIGAHGARSSRQCVATRTGHGKAAISGFHKRLCFGVTDQNRILFGLQAEPLSPATLYCGTLEVVALLFARTEENTSSGGFIDSTHGATFTDAPVGAANSASSVSFIGWISNTNQTLTPIPPIGPAAFAGPITSPLARAFRRTG